MTRVAIIGAGFAGLACARALTAAGFEVQAFDKGRGPGGRAASRRAEGGWQFDHGLPHLHAESAAFQEVLEGWQAEGRIAPWTGRFGHLGPNGFEETPMPDLFVGIPKMNAVLAADTGAVAFSQEISAVQPEEGGWIAQTKDGARHGPFDRIALAVPAPQAVPLLAATPDLAQRAAAARYRPQWTGMIAFDASLPVPFEAAAVADDPVLGWMVRDNAKPGRPVQGHTWVVHAADDWTAAHLEDTKEDTARVLTTAFQRILAGQGFNVPEPVIAMAHRWRYSRVASPVGEAALFDSVLGIGACGDWCLGPNVEHAWASGSALAERIMRSV